MRSLRFFDTSHRPQRLCVTTWSCTTDIESSLKMEVAARRAVEARQAGVANHWAVVQRARSTSAASASGVFDEYAWCIAWHLKSAVLRLARCRGDRLGCELRGWRPRATLSAGLGVCRLPSRGGHGHGDQHEQAKSKQRRGIVHAHRTDQTRSISLARYLASWACSTRRS